MQPADVTRMMVAGTECDYCAGTGRALRPGDWGKSEAEGVPCQGCAALGRQLSAVLLQYGPTHLAADAALMKAECGAEPNLARHKLEPGVVGVVMCQPTDLPTCTTCLTILHTRMRHIGVGQRVIEQRVPPEPPWQRHRHHRKRRS